MIGITVWFRLSADLETARNICPNRLDFTRLLPEVDRNLA